jgi:hypothetical protein
MCRCGVTGDEWAAAKMSAVEISASSRGDGDRQAANQALTMSNQEPTPAWRTLRVRAPPNSHCTRGVTERTQIGRGIDHAKDLVRLPLNGQKTEFKNQSSVSPSTNANIFGRLTLSGISTVTGGGTAPLRGNSIPSIVARHCLA